MIMKKRVLVTSILPALLSGVLLAASFAPVGLSILAWVAFVPLFISLERASQDSEGAFKRVVVTGFAFGVIFFLATVYWVVNSMYNFGGVPIIVSIGVMLLMVVYLSVYPALFCVGFYFTRPLSPAVRVLFIPSLWVPLEWLRGVLFTGFPWVLAGYSQANHPLLIQTADLFGVYGIGFVILSVNTAIYLALRSRVGLPVGGAETGLTQVAPVIVSLLLFGFTIIYGVVALGAVEERISGWKKINAAVAQGNINQSVKWDPKHAEKTVDIYKRLSLRAASAGDVELIVWPETSVPFYLAKERALSRKVLGTAPEAGASILTGSPHYEFKDRNPLYFNSAFLISTSGTITGRYDKIKLVPFGEYVPLNKILFFIKKLTVGIGDFTPGPGPNPIDFNGSTLGVLICFESVFPDIAGAQLGNGAGLLAVITNDGWFGRTSAPYQHFDKAVMRAVEGRVYVLRSANTGISGVIDPLGRVIEKTALFTEDVINARVGIREGPLTFYTRYPWVLPALTIVFSAAVLLFVFVRRRALFINVGGSNVR